MVGARLCDEVRRRDPDGRRVRLTVLGAEPRPAYNRVLLSTVRAGGPAARSTTLYTGGWAARRRIDLRTGVAAVAVDRTARVVRTDDGAEEPYDELVLATGSRAWLPLLQGIGTDGVTAFRDLADCARIFDLARPGTRFAVPGGGLLGCEAPRGPAGRGARVTLLHRGSHPMERQIEPAVEHVLAGWSERVGVVGLPDAAASMIGSVTGPSLLRPTTGSRCCSAGRCRGRRRPRQPGRSPNAAVVCRCNIVTRGVLVAAWGDGATDPGALARVTTGWGSCGDPVRGISAWLAESDPSTEEAA